MNPGADSGFPSFQWQRRGPAVFSPCWRGGLCSSSQFGKCANALAPADKTASLMGVGALAFIRARSFPNCSQLVCAQLRQWPNFAFFSIAKRPSGNSADRSFDPLEFALDFDEKWLCASFYVAAQSICRQAYIQAASAPGMPSASSVL